jgi:hypothetical protein
MTRPPRVVSRARVSVCHARCVGLWWTDGAGRGHCDRRIRSRGGGTMTDDAFGPAEAAQ